MSLAWLRLPRALGQAHAALGIGAQFLELALAASTGVDLRLHDIERPGQLLCGFDRFFHGQAAMPLGTATPNFASSSLA
jgi:hypothetical protein